MANEMFPSHERAVMLDGIGYFDTLMEESPEDILEISDWMNLPLENAVVTLDRLKNLLIDSAEKVSSL